MSLLICPDCLAKEKRNILGSVTDDGNLVVQRYHQAITIVMSKNFSIFCQCGFGTTLIQNGTTIPYISGD